MAVSSSQITVSSTITPVLLVTAGIVDAQVSLSQVSGVSTAIYLGGSDLNSLNGYLSNPSFGDPSRPMLLPANQSLWALLRVAGSIVLSVLKVDSL